MPTSLDPQIASCHRQDAGPPQVEESRQREFLLFSGFQVWRTGTLSRPWAGQAFIRTGGNTLFFRLFQPGPEIWMQLMY